MKQINVNVTPDFDRDLRRLMQARRIGTKSDAIRQAVHEAAERKRAAADFDFHAWIGAGLEAGPLNKKPKFKSHDELW
jgi:Arc/MetJ-type ribon-helix-helix transcriptional regulator